MNMKKMAIRILIVVGVILNIGFMASVFKRVSEGHRQFRNQTAEGPQSKPAVTAIVALGAVLAYLGFGIQKRLYRGRAHRIAAYCVVVILGGVVVLGATSL